MGQRESRKKEDTSVPPWPLHSQPAPCWPFQRQPDPSSRACSQVNRNGAGRVSWDVAGAKNGEQKNRGEARFSPIFSLAVFSRAAPQLTERLEEAYGAGGSGSKNDMAPCRY